PPKTAAFWDIVNVARVPEDAELADLLDKLGPPNAVTVADLIVAATGEITEWLANRKNRRALPHRLERCGYVSVRNPFTKEGLWTIKGVRQVIYARTALSPERRMTAAKERAARQ